MKERSAPRDQTPATPPPAVSWQFRILVVLIGAGVLGLVLKTVGLF